MCPACMAGAALIGGTVMSAGGLTSLVAGIVRPNKNTTNHSNSEVGRRNENGNDEHPNSIE